MLTVMLLVTQLLVTQLTASLHVTIYYLYQIQICFCFTDCDHHDYKGMLNTRMCVNVLFKILS